MSNYPPGTSAHDPAAPWNEPELDYEAAERHACDTEYGHAAQWIEDWLQETMHTVREPAADLNGPASNAELFSILFRHDVTARQQHAAIANLRARYLKHVESQVEELAIARSEA